MTPERRRELTLLRGARDHIDRCFADPLDVARIAATAFMSPAHFSRRFRDTYGETPSAYLMTRRIERACALLRADVSVTEAYMRVGCTSLGSFSSRFRTHVGMTATAYRAREHPGEQQLPECLVRAVVRRPSRIREAGSRTAA